MKRFLFPALILVVLLSHGCAKDSDSTSGENGEMYQAPVDYAEPDVKGPTELPSVEGPTTPPPEDY